MNAGMDIIIEAKNVTVNRGANIVIRDIFSAPILF